MPAEAVEGDLSMASEGEGAGRIWTVQLAFATETVSVAADSLDWSAERVGAPDL